MIQAPATMESNLSLLSSLKEEFKPEDYIQPHYRESYRLAIDCLVNGGKTVYQEFVKAEKITSFLSDHEIDFIIQNAEQPPASVQQEETTPPADEEASTGTYWPTHSDAPPPDLDMGWPEVIHTRLQTNIDLLYHPPRLNSPTIKEVLRKHIQDARQVIAIAMDVFTDVDLFKEVVDASVRGVPVYILLDHTHFKSFLTMAENHDTQIQKLRNMRVRTVKGQEYLCRSGAKFHGGMGQKFLLVDCHTVFFGSYSFMWSYEKIHLSMVQVITGRLVESYDEEFRTLYARSTIPVEIQPQEISAERRLNGKVEGYLGHPTKAFERNDHLRHTLESVYRQTCERQPGFKSTMEDLPVVPITPHSRFLQETTEFNKRHSYAGERREPSYIPHLSRYGSSNWNVAEESRRYVGNHFPSAMENTYESSRVNLMNRSTNLRQSYHGHDKQILSMQQNLPSLANTSKSFLRTWRIESYLNNNEVPLGESYDYLDPYEMENKPAPAMHSRLRSSLVFKSTIPEQPETSSYTNGSSSSIRLDDQFGARPSAQYYSSSQWNQTGLMDNRDEFMMKRRSMQILEPSANNMSYTSGRDALYASLGRAKGRILAKDPEQENLYKRHSVADPRYNSYSTNVKESSSHMYGSLARRHTEKSTPVENSRGGGYAQNLKEDQRSVSHHDFKKAESKEPPCTIWLEPPSRTVSATVLEVEDLEPSKVNGMSSPRFFKKSTKKIKSLLNIPEKRETSPKRKNLSSTKVGGSSDTMLSEDGDQKPQDCTAVSVKSSDSSRLKLANGRLSGNENHAAALPGEPSSSRFGIEELHGSAVVGGTARTSGQLYTKASNERSGVARGTSLREPVGASRLYSRFEPLCTFEAKRATLGRSSNLSAHNRTEKHGGSYASRGNSSTEQSNRTASHTQAHENKLGRFIQRVGNLINKNK
ncbi:hypothetical protein NFI96_019137 [Prochilodus magdalenae]|nr:hypothetical protein NFI96_019137 [Prochilodus magdalenae]